MINSVQKCFFLLFSTILILQMMNCAPSSTSHNSTRKTICPPHIEKQIDKLTLRLYTYGRSGRSFPESFKDFPEYCNETKHLTKQFHNFVEECIGDSFTQNMLKIVIYSIEKEAKQLCKMHTKPSRRQSRLLDAAPCANSVKNLHHKCTQRSIRYLMDSIDIKDNHKKLGFICCNVQHMDTCMQDAMVSNKSSKCSRKHGDITMEFLNELRGNMLDFLCSSFDTNTDQCDPFISEKPKSDTSGYSFYIMPLIKSLANVDVKLKF